MKKQIEKLIQNLLADNKKLIPDGITLMKAMKHINEGQNVETVKKAITDGTQLESIFTS